MNCVHTSSNTAQCFKLDIKTSIKTVSPKSEVQNSIYLFSSPNTQLAGIMVCRKAGFTSALDFPYHRLRRICSPSSCLCRTLQEQDLLGWESTLWMFLQRWHRTSYAILLCQGCSCLGWENYERLYRLNCNEEIVFWTSSYLLPWSSPFSPPTSASVSMCNSLHS